MSKIERELERKIVRKMIAALLGAGYRLSVSLERGFDLDEMLLGSRDPAAILKAAFSGDDCHVFVHEKDSPLLTGNREVPYQSPRLIAKGWVFLVVGNGADIISDYTTNLEEAIQPANALAAKYA
jgi:hypothetical protein